jgi:hypothetical protein
VSGGERRLLRAALTLLVVVYAVAVTRWEFWLLRELFRLATYGP